MRSLEVQVCWHEPTFDSFEEACAATARAPRHQRAVADTDSIAGTTIVSARYAYERVSFALSDGRFLSILMEGPLVNWLISDAPCIAFSEGKNDPQDLLLHFPDSNLREPWLWKRETVIAERLN